MKWSLVTSGFALMAALAVSAPSFAGTARWSGYFVEGGHDIAVELREASGANGKSDWSAHYAGPGYQCSVFLTYVRKDKDTSYFTVKKGSGGKCDTLRDGKLILKSHGSDQMDYQLLKGTDVLQSFLVTK